MTSEVIENDIIMEDYPRADLPTAPVDTRSPEEISEEKRQHGNQLYKTQMYKAALEMYSEAIRLCPKIAAYYGNRCACYMMMNRYQEAINDARHSVQLEPAILKGYIRLLKCAIALGDTTTGDTCLQHIEQLAGNCHIAAETDSMRRLKYFEGDARTAATQKDYRKIVYCMDRLLEVAPACQHYKTTKAENLAFLGRYSEAQEIVNNILHVDSVQVEAIYVRGVCLYYEDHVENALKHFQQVSRLAPDHQKAPEMYRQAKELARLKEAGNEAYKNRHLQQAIDLYTQALQVDALNRCANAKLYFNRATAHHSLKNVEMALSDCNAALDLDENYLKALLRRGACHTQLEQFEEAVTDYEKVCKLQRSAAHSSLLKGAKLALKRSKRKDYYKILKVARDATSVDIKKAYRKKALELHPDRHPGATAQKRSQMEIEFKELGEAYSVLSDTKKRTRYDNGTDIEDLNIDHNFDAHHVFQTFCNGGGMEFSTSGFPGGFFSFQM